MVFIIGMVLCFNLQTDSLKVDSVVSTKSIMFQNQPHLNANPYLYKHSQGFFCDFEDNINKKNKIQLNIGIGDQ